MKKLSFLFLLLLAFGMVEAQENINKNPFRQLGQELPTPNSFRTASGAPGHEYYQQRADYDMEIELDDENQKIYGSEEITYYNNSPDALSYLWVQLDQNVRALNSQSYDVSSGRMNDRMSFGSLERLHPSFDGGFKVEHVKDARGSDLNYTVNYTMMRVELPSYLRPGQKFTFQIKWWYNINDRMKIGGRSGYEYFEEDDNYLYTIAQFFPRMCVYNDVEGWQNKQFLGRGEFALPFGDYEVAITVPSDHVVASTGELQNASSVMSSAQRRRMREAESASKPVMIITEEEARKNEKDKAKGKKTWVFKAENVRDFGFASSRKFLWDAQGVKFGNRTVMAMSFYPKEGNPLWEKYSTRAVVQTLKTYSKFTFDYPYPVAISVNAKRIGMEYPMICFNFGRPEADGTYSDRTKYGMIGVIIHEVGHNYFPMIVNSDERQWTWMDEGLNTFLQYLTEQEFEEGYPSRRGPAYKITDYMGGAKDGQMPIMTNSESIYQFGNNAYGKPATALNVLRETVMGRELFDYAFKEYAQRWMFKHPTPADFFRTMEDASAVDLDWFWRGWFYTTDHVDIGMEKVTWYQPSTGDPEVEKPMAKERDALDRDISDIRNQGMDRLTDRDPEAVDFYTEYDPYKVDALDKKEYEDYIRSLNDDEKAWLNSGYNYYEITFKNHGGLVMPLILEFEFEDGTTEVKRIPAEIWKMNDKEVTKVFVTDKPALQITLDPFRELADVDMNNNYWPPRMLPTRFELYKQRSRGSSENLMQRDQRAKELE